MLVVLILLLAYGPAQSFTNALLPRPNEADVVEDASGVITLQSNTVGTGTMVNLTNVTNRYDQAVSVTVELTGSSGDWGSLFIDGVDYGDRATVSDLDSGDGTVVDIAMICDDGILSNNVTYDVTATGGGLTGTFSRSSGIDRRCIPWYDAADWDANSSEHGVVHEGFGDHDAGDVELGYRSSEPGLVSYWPLDEDTGSTAADVSGPNNGSINGATVGQGGVLNTTAYGFDGTNDDVTVPTDPTINITGDLTAGAWIEPDTAPAAQTLTSQGYVGHQFIGLKWDGGDTDCTSDADFDPTMINPYGDAAYGDNNWHSGSSWGVYDTSNSGVYGDYAPYQIDFDTVWGSDASDSEAYAGAYLHSPDSRTVDISIGSDDTRKLYVNGALVHQECVDQALTEDDSTVSVTLQEGWNTVVVMVNEDSGGWGLQWRVSSANNASLEYTADPAVVLDKRGYQISLKGSDVTGWYGDTSVDAPVPTGAYSHVALRANGTDVSMFVNGSELGSRAQGSTPTASTDAIVMGENLDGRVDEVRLYDQALTGAEMESLARGVSPADPNADWNGTHVTGWETTDVNLSAGSLTLSDVVASVSGGSATVYVEADTNGDNVTDETSDPIVLTTSTGPYSVTGIATDNDKFRLRVELNTTSVTDSPCFSGATLSPGDGLSIGTRSGCGKTNATQNQPPTADFTYTDAGSTWYNGSWSYRKAITIDHTRVAATQTDFPVMIDLSDSDLAAKAQPDGDDLLFTSGDGTTKIDHEIESYNSSTGDLVAWVEVPQVNATSPDTTIYLYYNNSAAPNQENAAGTWGPDYTMVQHLEESSGTPTDSSGNGNDGTNNGATQGATGQIDGGYEVGGSGDYVEVPDSINDGPFTVQLWFESPGSSWSGTLFDATYGGSKYFHISATDADLDWCFESADDSDVTVDADPDLSNGNWHQVTVTGEFSSSGPHELYLDGASQGSDSTTVDGKSNLDPPRIGYYTETYDGGCGTKADFNGGIDEVRIVSRTLSSSWISTEYNNTADPSSFYTVGAEATKNSVTFDASPSSDADGTIVSYKWDFDDDGTYESFSTTPTATTTLSAGDHDVTLEVIDDDSATDTTTKTVTVVTQSPVASFTYDETWGYRKSITIDHTRVASDLSDYPVLISLTDPDLAAKAQNDGDDILFAASDGTRLDHEIESFNGSSGELVAWVKVPTVDASEDTTHYLYYNNSAAANQENVTGVWSNGYEAVWHLDETGTTAVDSTGNGHNGTINAGVTTGAPGQVGPAIDVGATTDGWVNVSHDAAFSFGGTEDYTISAWTSLDDTGSTQWILSKGGGDTNWALETRELDGDAAAELAHEREADDGTDVRAFEGTDPTTGTWYHLVGTYDAGSTTMEFYQDGSLRDSATFPPGGTSVGTNTEDVGIGRNSADFGEYTDGTIDEARVSSVRRSDGWIETTYNNTANPSSFYTVGAESTVTAATVNASASYDPDGSITSYEWDWDDDGAYEDALTSPRAVHDFGSTGTYDVTLRVTDNQGVTNTTTETLYLGNQLPAPAFASSTWTDRKQLTIDHTRVASDLSGFPVLVDVTDSDLANDAQADGDDIHFTAADGETKLAHEIESYNASSGHLVAWVRVPNVSSTADTTLYLYYNNSAAANQENVTGVWDSNYKMVQHLEESSGDATDSTTFANDGTTVAVTARGQPGMAGDAYDFEASNNDGVEVPDDATLDITSQVTLSAWIRPETVNDWNRIVAKSHTSNTDPWTMYGLLFDNADHLRMEISDCTSSGCQNGLNGGTTVPTTSWTHATAVYNGTHMALYFNGTQDGVTALSTTIATNDVELTMGKSGFDADYYDGLMDEVRVSDTARSPAWIAATYNNTADPTGFVTVGPAEDGNLARFDASNSSDPDGTITTYEWDFTTDGSYDESGSVPTTRHRYSSTGTYNVTLRVTDDDGATNTTTSSVTFPSTPNAAPTAIFTHSPTYPATGETVTFDASGSSDSDGSISTYKWDWDDDGTFDNTTGSPTINHTFTSSGDHNVTLEVVDNDGATNSTTKTVSVIGGLAYQLQSNNSLTLLNRAGELTSFGFTTKGFGPAQLDLDGDGVAEVPYVDGGSGITIIDENGNSKQLVSSGVTNDIRLGVGDYDGDGTPGVIYSNASDNNYLYRVEDGEGTAIIGTGHAAQSLAGVADLNDDGDEDVIYTDTNGNLVYLDNGSVTDLGVNPSAQNKIGTPADFDDDGVMRIPYVDPNNDEIMLIDSAGNTELVWDGSDTNLGSIASIDWNKDGTPDIVMVYNADKKLYWIDYTDGSRNGPITDDGGSDLTGDSYGVA